LVFGVIMGILNEILRESFITFLWVGSILGILVGVAMWLRPKELGKLNRQCSRLVSSDTVATIMDKSRLTERFFYRHHQLVGAGILIGSLVVLYTFLFSFNVRTISTLIPNAYWWLTDALVAILLVGSILAALVGLLVLLKPSLLREVEHLANRWVSTDKMLTVVNRMNFSVEESMLRHNKIAAASIIAGSLYIMVILGHFLFRGSVKF